MSSAKRSQSILLYDDGPSFKTSIYRFIRASQIQNISGENTPQDIKKSSDTYGFRQRLFYDVLNVMESIGCCTNNFSQNRYIWNGYKTTKKTIKNLCASYGCFSKGKKLDEIMSGSGAISIGRVAKEIIVLFIALEVHELNLLETSKYLSRSNGMEKTTKCKLYQAVSILEVAGIVSKLPENSEYSISKEYFISATMEMIKNDDPTSIGSLLQTAPSFIVDVMMKERRAEYNNVCHNMIADEGE